ncbi:hypothetical protein HY988_01005 [Candidatus Micrarchaeota archaeon]|nr:hypothetical protein [Candidatus Micrarchaeota archaeon]
MQSTESELPLPKSERIVLEIPSLGVLDSALPFRAVTAQFDAEKVFFTHVPLGIEIRELASSLDFSVPISVQLSSDQASFEFDLTSASTHQSNSIQIKDGESSEASVSKGTLPVLLQKKPGKPRSNLRPVAIRRVDGAASKIRTSKIRTSNVVSQNLRRFRFVSLVQKKLQIPRADSKPPEILKTRRKIQTLEIRTEPTKEQSKLEKSKPNCPKKEQITLVDKNAKEAKLKSVQLSAAYPVSSEYSKIRKTSTKAKPSRTLLGPFFTSEASLQKNRPRTRNIRNVFALLK